MCIRCPRKHRFSGNSEAISHNSFNLPLVGRLQITGLAGLKSPGATPGTSGFLSLKQASVITDPSYASVDSYSIPTQAHVSVVETLALL